MQIGQDDVYIKRKVTLIVADFDTMMKDYLRWLGESVWSWTLVISGEASLALVMDTLYHILYEAHASTLTLSLS